MYIPSKQDDAWTGETYMSEAVHGAKAAGVDAVWSECDRVILMSVGNMIALVSS